MSEFWAQFFDSVPVARTEVQFHYMAVCLHPCSSKEAGISCGKCRLVELYPPKVMVMSNTSV